MQKKYILGVLTALVLALNACGKKEEAPQPQSTPAPTAPLPSSASGGVTVDTITLGNAVGANKKVTRTTNSFGKTDTIYASVDTTGGGNATLRAEWKYRKAGQELVLKQDTQTITPTGPATSEFHISKPDGWPAGDYQVEIFMEGKSAGTKTFTVK